MALKHLNGGSSELRSVLSVKYMLDLEYLVWKNLKYFTMIIFVFDYILKCN